MCAGLQGSLTDLWRRLHERLLVLRAIPGLFAVGVLVNWTA